MRLLIRPEQMSVIQADVEEKFVRRLSSHIRQNYARASVTPSPEEQKTTVGSLSDETLDSLVRAGIKSARSLDFTYESSISAFTALMFEVAPNFDSHELVQPFITNEEVKPNERLNPLLEQLTEKDWATIRKTYDASAWQPKEEEEENSSEEGKIEEEEKSEE